MPQPEPKVYPAIIKAVEAGDLVEPFTRADFRQACPGFADGTYRVLLSKHRAGNPGGRSELFVRVGHGLYRLLRPIKHRAARGVIMRRLGVER